MTMPQSSQERKTDTNIKQAVLVSAFAAALLAASPTPKLVLAPLAFVALILFVKIFELYESATRIRPLDVPTQMADELIDYSAATGPLYTTDPAGEAIVRVSKSGWAALEPTSLPRLFKQATARFPDKPALRVEADGVNGGGWVTYSWAEYYAESQRVAQSLLALGLEAHDRVNIVGFNSPEWFIAEMGTLLAGGAAAGVYASNGPDACKYIAVHSSARVIFCEGLQQVDKYLGFREQLPDCLALVVWGGGISPEEIAARASLPREGGRPLPVYSWSDFLALGGVVPLSEVEARSEAVRPGHVATLVYTSGTTGNPKAVMVSNDNMIWTSLSASSPIFAEGVKAGVSPPENLKIVSYLPLSHVLGQILDLIGPMVVTACGAGYGPDLLARHYMTTWFARPDALKSSSSLKSTLVAARPTLFVGVPRVWEKIKEGIQQVGKKTPAPIKAVSDWAKRLSLAAALDRQVGREARRSLPFLIARHVVLNRIKAAIGLDQCLVHYTGSAPMGRDVFDYFASLDIDILDTLGASEASGPTTLNTPMMHRLGTLGAPIPGVEVSVDHQPGRDKPGEGEIIYRGRNVCMGYMNDEAKTAEAIDKDGWFHSGDVGSFEDGLLRITGRIKELLITAGGENIAPVPIEERLKELCPALSNAMLVGDKRKYNVVLLTAKTVLDLATGLSTGTLALEALEVSSAATDAEAVAESQRAGAAWQRYIQRGIDEYNATYAVSNAQKIQKFVLLPGDFSERGGELTPTLKLRRAAAVEKYAAAIERLYS